MELPPTSAWAPQPGPQHALVQCPLPEILFGGARGGGKTDGILGKFGIKERRYGAKFNAAFFRREMPQQDDLIERAKEIYEPCGARWHEQKKLFAMPHGGRIRFRPLESTSDAEKYQGQNLTDAAVEEAGNYPTSAAIDRLFGCLRSPGGVPVQLMLTANPGGAGHHWIKQRYIDPHPLGMRTIERKLKNGAIHLAVYIPSKVQNNRVLLHHDPGYIDRLYLVGSDALVAAWLTGDWNVIEGAYFPEFRTDVHVIKPFSIPSHWLRFRAGDWGSAKPFSIGWYAVSGGDVPGIPKDALVKYREWYGMQEDRPNVGLKLTAEEVAAGIKEREHENECHYGVLDPSAFAEDGGPSIAERMARMPNFIVWGRADNRRVRNSGAMGGWDQMRARLKGEDNKPMLLFFSTCTHTIRTLPTAQHDPLRSEDLDSSGEDHACFAAGTVIDGENLVERVGILTRRSAKVIRLSFSNGAIVVCTPDHKFLTENGQWIEAIKLLNLQLCSAERLKSSKASGITSAAFTFSARVVDCIARFGSEISDKFLMASMFITETRTALTIPLKIFSCFQVQRISRYTQTKNQSSALKQGPQPAHGTAPMKEENGTSGNTRAGYGRYWRRWLISLARIAGRLSRQSACIRLSQNTAIQTARPVHCVRVELLSERQDVYCIAKFGGYLSVGGAVASNCDETRYACMSRPYAAPLPRKLEPPRGALTIQEMVDRYESRNTDIRRI